MQKPLWEEILKALGINTTRLRWKWKQYQIRKERQANRKENEKRVLHYQHKVCSECGLTVDKNEKQCPRCKTRLANATASKFSRYFHYFFPEISINYSLTFIMLNLVFYVVMAMKSGGISAIFTGPTTKVALHFGAWHLYFLAFEGQWWRLLTAAFIHFGPLHIIFNMLWIAQLGPSVEELIGRSRYLILYVSTAIGGFIFSAGYRLYIVRDIRGGIGGGASGVVFGLIGAALVFAYVRKLPGTHFFKEGLIKWAIFGVIISFMPGIDLMAHLGGAVVGGALALILMPPESKKALPKPLILFFELVCLMLIVSAFALTIMHPPKL